VTHPHDHDHSHGGIRSALRHALVPHTHDAADSIDDALEASRAGVRALVISFAVLLVTTALQFVVVLLSGSVALLADTVHNLADALTAVPLWFAFVLGRRVATRRYTFGFGRGEDLAGLAIVAVVALSAVVAAWQSIERLLHPQPLADPWFVIAAGVVGFAGNEIVAVYRIRTGQRIGSAALVADGVHARLDGFTSLAVVVGGIGVLVGLPILDPVVGIVISIAIVVLLVGTARSVGRRLMDGIDPDLLHRAEHALLDTPGVTSLDSLQLRWVGHRLQGAAVVRVESMTDADATVHEAEHALGRALPHLEAIVIRPRPASTAEHPRVA
jgi:cation diffusion facilitator family transporter